MNEWETSGFDEDDCESCDHCYQSGYEYDTGYYECMCSLLDKYCDPEHCPLNYKYKIED